MLLKSSYFKLHVEVVFSNNVLLAIILCIMSLLGLASGSGGVHLPHLYQCAVRTVKFCLYEMVSVKIKYETHYRSRCRIYVDDKQEKNLGCNFPSHLLVGP